MDRSSSTRRLGMPALALVLAGCNAVLGIHEPGDLDGGGAPRPAPTKDAANPPPNREASMPAPGRDTAAYPWANWPMPNPPSTGLPNPQSYDMSTKEGVVIDLVTGLEWQATVDEPKYAWRDAAGYCTGLDLDGGGFRVPSRIELLSIVDYTQPGPVLDARVFPNTPSEPFWTASPLVSDAASAWSVHFGFATTIATASQTMTELHVRCVRGMGGSQ